MFLFDSRERQKRQAAKGQDLNSGHCGKDSALIHDFDIKYNAKKSNVLIVRSKENEYFLYSSYLVLLLMCAMRLHISVIIL